MFHHFSVKMLLGALVLATGFWTQAIAGSAPPKPTMIAVGGYDSADVNAVAGLITKTPGGTILPVKDPFAAIESLRNSKVDVAVIPSDIVWAAMKSRAPFIGKPNFEDLRAIGTITSESFIMLTRQLRGLRRIAQMDHYRVGIVGNVYDTFDYILEANKMTTNDMDTIKPFTPAESVEAICNGDIDLLIMFAGQNNPHVREMYNRCPIMFAPLDDETLHQVLARYPYFAPEAFQTKWYHPTAYVHGTFGRGIMVMGRKNTPEDTVAYWAKVLSAQDNIGGNAPWLVSGRPAKDMAQIYNIPVHESLYKVAPQPEPAVTPTAQEPQKPQTTP